MLHEDTAVKDAIYESLNSLHDVAQLFSGPIFSGASFDRVFETFGSGPNRKTDIDEVRNFRVYKTFFDMENCDNQVTSDRVAILSNIMGFQWRLPTTSFFSYSFALVMLLSANNCLPSVLVREKTPTPSNPLIYHPVHASGLILLAYQMKHLIAGGKEALRKELENVSCALTDFFGRDITQHKEIWDAIEDAVKCLPGESSEDPLSLLSEIEMPNLKRQDVIPLSATIGDIVGCIVPEGHRDDIGLQYRHGEAVVRHGIATHQLKEGATFMAFAGEYRWRSEFIGKGFR